jgi:hypothetical protein
MEQRRPIDAIGDPRDRSAARRAREWIRRVLLEVPTDPNGGM